MKIIFKIKPLSLLAICFILVACVQNQEDTDYYQIEEYQLEDYHTQENILAKPLKQANEYDPNRLIGLSYGEIYQKLGAPDFARPEGNKEFVQYRDKDCLLDLFIEYWEGVPPRDPQNAEIGKQRRQNSSITYAKLRDSYRDANVPPAILRQCLYMLMEQREK
ncbi:MAG: hypothetical protein K0U45_02820 [Alphaproteobacteria bacterium]|nr:hypothetical protein [Alphaproteobacteria bacterium]